MGREVLSLSAVETDADVERLRQIRNDCREWMTGSTREISEAEQRAWWRRVSGSGSISVWLVRVPEAEEAVGFALVKQGVIDGVTDFRWYVTLGLVESWRGRGLGTHVYRLMRGKVPPGSAVHALIDRRNEASIRAAERAGYVRVHGLSDDPSASHYVHMVGSNEA